MRELADYGIDINAINGRRNRGGGGDEEDEDDRTVRERSYTPEDTIETRSRPHSSQNASHPLALPRSQNTNTNNQHSYRDEPSSYRNNTQSSARQHVTGTHSVYSDGNTHDDDATVITYSDSDVDV